MRSLFEESQFLEDFPTHAKEVAHILNMEITRMYERKPGEPRKQISIPKWDDYEFVIEELFCAGFITKINERDDEWLVSFWSELFCMLKFDTVKRRMNRKIDKDYQLFKDVVYIMIDGSNSCKIGYTGDIKTRVRTLKQTNPTIKILRAYYGNYELEARMHLKFDSKRISHEWFKLDRDDILWMDNNLSRVKEELLPQSFLWRK